jgi:MFS family permease
MKLTRIQKLYLSNFLTGLVFWYGIEKLFMKSIGIDAFGIGIATAFISIFNLILDIPAGILADKWSRKGMLVVSAIALVATALTLGTSHSLLQYIIGYAFYGINVVATSGTYQAIMYDSLREDGHADLYSKINGRAYALFLVGAGVANIASGFWAHHFGYRSTYFISIISCLMNVVVILSIREPAYHKPEQKEKVIKQLGTVSKEITRMKLLRTLAIVMTVLAVVEVFKIDFGQLYMLRYISQPQLIGLLWAAYAFTWALGSAIAHRLKAHLTPLVVATVLPLVFMAFVDNAFSLVLFMVQAVAAAALFNQIETRIQDSTPSAVRASVLSLLSVVGRMMSIPASFVLGWLFNAYGAFWALRFVAAVATAVLIFWFWAKAIDSNEPHAVTLD